MSIKLTIEMAPFNIANGTTEEELLTASEKLEYEFLSMRDGYLGRVLVRKEDEDRTLGAPLFKFKFQQNLNYQKTIQCPNLILKWCT